MTGSFSRGVALVGTVALGILLVQPPDVVRLLAAAPLAVLLLAGLKPLRYWPIATASVMLPYFSWGVMRILTEPAARGDAAVFAGLSIVVFLAALDSMRRR